MAEMHPASAANAGISPAHGSILITLQHDVGTIKQEIKDLRTMVESLIKEIKDVKRVKVETVGDPFPLSFPSVRHYIPVFASGFFFFFFHKDHTVDPPRNRHFFFRSSVPSSGVCDAYGM